MLYFSFISNMNQALLPPANVVCEGYVFTPVCDSVNRGACVVALGGARAWLLWGGMCGCSGGHAWLLRGGGGGMHSCSGGMHGCSQGGMHGFFGGGVGAWFFLGGAWFLPGGLHGFFWGACMVFSRGHVWFFLGGHA